MHIEHRDVCVAAAHGGSLKQLAADALTAHALQHRDAEFRCALVAFSGQIGKVTDAHQLQLVIEHAEDGVAREVDGPDVVFNDMVRHDLAEPEEAVVFVQRQKVRLEALPVDGREFPNQSMRGAGSR